MSLKMISLWLLLAVLNVVLIAASCITLAEKGQRDWSGGKHLPGRKGKIQEDV